MKALSLLTLATLLFTSVTARAATCEESDYKYWYDYAEELISPKNYKFVNMSPQLFELELAVVQNSFITAAYSRLYQEELKYAPERAKAYLWLPGAAFASFEVGQVIRHGYYAVADYRGVKGYGPAVYGQNPLSSVMLGNLGITREQVALELIEGNLAVYRDLYWQHLAVSECGIDTVIRVLEEMERTAHSQSDYLHYINLENGWKLIKQGKYVEGNLALTRVEQEAVLQPNTYSGPMAKIFGRVFAKIAISPLKDPGFSFPDFITYCKPRKLTPNFSNFNSRWPWIVDQMKAMGTFFKKHPDRLKQKHLDFIQDSRKHVGYLNDPTVRFLNVGVANQ